MFFKRKHPLTKLCERASLRMVENAASDDVSLLRRKFDERSKRAQNSNTERGWSAWMRDDVENLRRTIIVYLIIYLAAAAFWKDANKITEEPDWGGSKNPFKKTNSDVIVAEALMFLWYNFFLVVRDAVKRKELTQADNQAVADAGITICHVIQETTQWRHITQILSARMDEYDNRDTSRNPIEAFSGVVVRSIGKQSIDDPDRLNPLSLADTPIAVRTMIHMTAKLQAYIEVYKNIVEHYPMD